MWAQLITSRLKPGHEVDVPRLVEELEAAEQPGSGLLRSTTMIDHKDPTRLFILVVFESEEKARSREQDPRRQEGLTKVREIMAEILDGPPEFVDLAIVNDRVY
jgi:quinol monooxygenase YgiN